MAKGFLKLPNLHMLIKQKSRLLPRDLALVNFGELLIVSSTKVNLLYLFYSTVQWCFFLDSGISLSVFPSMTNLKMHNISVSPKMVKKIIMNLDLPKASSPDCIPVVVLRNCEPELSYILTEPFNKCL